MLFQLAKFQLDWGVTSWKDLRVRTLSRQRICFSLLEGENLAKTRSKPALLRRNRVNSAIFVQIFKWT